MQLKKGAVKAQRKQIRKSLRVKLLQVTEQKSHFREYLAPGTGRTPPKLAPTITLPVQDLLISTPTIWSLVPI